MEINQINHTTMYNRHPEIFAECREILGDNLKILSFGCSTGEEVKTLKNLYFKNSQIDGFDLNENIIADIKRYRSDIDPSCNFFHSLNQMTENSYDVIFCLSVLTRNPDPDKTYSFKLFDDTLKIIDKYLKPNGHICIWNSRFEFRDSTIYDKYSPVEMKYKHSGYTKKFYKDFIKEKEEPYSFILFQKKVIQNYLTSIDEKSTINHVVNSINNSEIIDIPAPYIYIKNVFPDDIYESILGNQLKSSNFYKPQVHTGDPKYFYGSYDTRHQLYVPEDLENAETLEFFQQLKNVLSSKEVFDSLYLKFNEGFIKRFDSMSKDEIYSIVKPTLLLTKHKPGYFLGPHTDRREKVITCIFYFPERDNLEYLGTAMYLPKQKGLTCEGVVHHNPENFIYINTVPCKRNSALIFFRDSRLFHGVEKIKSEEDSERFNIQFNLWLPWGSSM